MNQQQFRNIVYLSDKSGTGAWRVIWPINSINCICQGLNMQADYSQTPILDQKYYQGMTSVTVQRWISPQQADLFCKFFKPIADATGGWLRYEEDDFMFDGTLLNESKREYIEKKYGDLKKNGIPMYNRGRKAFEGVAVQTNIKNMLNAADFVTTTTDYLKQVYHDFYDVPMENLIAVPNLLPKYLFGDRYDPAKKVKQFGKNKSKPRIGIVSSLSHYNVDNVRMTRDGLAVREQKQPDGLSKWLDEHSREVRFEDTMKIEDDFDDIAQLVRETVGDFSWVLFGYVPPQIKDLADQKLVECHGGVPIMQYPSMLENLQLQAVVAPIKKTVFNFCKSPIKYLECCSNGTPLFATDCLPYDRVMPKDQLFGSAEELKRKLFDLKCMSSDRYKDLIESQWKYLNSPTREGDFDLKNFWMEDNLSIYVDMYRMRSKGLTVSLSSFVRQYDERRKQAQENTIFNNGNVLITK